MANFLEVNVYELLLKDPVHFGKITFKPNVLIQVVVSYEGGGGGFSPLIIYNIVMKDAGNRHSFEEQKLGFDENSMPIVTFIEKNLGVLFKKVS